MIILRSDFRKKSSLHNFKESRFYFYQQARDSGLQKGIRSLKQTIKLKSKFLIF